VLENPVIDEPASTVQY